MFIFNNITEVVVKLLLENSVCRLLLAFKFKKLVKCDSETSHCVRMVLEIALRFWCLVLQNKEFSSNGMKMSLLLLLLFQNVLNLKIQPRFILMPSTACAFR